MPVFLNALLAGVAWSADLWEKSRVAMVRDQIEARGVRNAQVLRAMRNTPRHLFVPPDVQPYAYEDRALMIGHEQTISQPYIVGVMSELLDVKPEHKVLEIGTGSGYQAAILAVLAKQVFTIEIVPALARSSRELLAKLGHSNVVAREADGYKGWPEEAPFDRIILTAAPTELPRALVDQLKPGGKLVAPVGRNTQELIVLDKRNDGSTHQRSVLPVMFVPMVPGRR